MIATELRIGNIVSLSNIYNRVLTIAAKELEVTIELHIDYKQKEIPIRVDEIENFEGVTLTEEILLKCGFDNSHKIEIYADSNLELIGGGISYTPFYNELDADDGSIKAEVNFRELKYLHELQNLYFSLTGKELIYDPK